MVCVFVVRENNLIKSNQTRWLDSFVSNTIQVFSVFLALTLLEWIKMVVKKLNSNPLPLLQKFCQSMLCLIAHLISLVTLVLQLTDLCLVKGLGGENKFKKGFSQCNITVGMYEELD